MRTERAISSQPHANVTTVEDIPFFRMSAPFAGYRRNEELRPVRRVGRSSSLVDGRTGDIGCPLECPRRGTTSAGALNKRTHPTRETSTSLLPWRRVLHWVQRPVHANHHSTSRGVPLEGDAFEAGIAVGQTRENGRNRHRGWHESGVARLATSHRSQKERRGRKEKEDG